jgi:RHH-type proline utilization regulon transcriptional repressor/proline dehydrogenase/delta 1-pyrroline-5-carboxylate dehydrogenase
VIEQAAHLLEERAASLGALLVVECGKTPAETGEEIRRVVDLCRLYASQAKSDSALSDASPLGAVAVVTSLASPLYALVGYVAASLLTGNAVVAKPSSHASLVAHQAVQTFHAAGVPVDAAQLLLGSGETVGAALVRDPRVAAVLFAGTAAVANDVQRVVSTLPHAPSLVANTGGFNAMIVDSSALPEQVISDAVAGAFDCAGQQGSSLKLLCVQDSVADKIVGMLEAMLLERSVGDPRNAATDIGPVATEAIRDKAEAYLARVAAKGFQVIRTNRLRNADKGWFVSPAIVDVGSADAFAEIDQDVPGPILHVVRWNAAGLERLLAQLNEQAAVATLGLHTRINETTGQVLTQSRAEAIFVNRSIHSARVGMQVEGGTGRTGTGPSLSGPLMLSRLARRPAALIRVDQGPFARRRACSSQKFHEYPVAKDGLLQDRAQLAQRTAAKRSSLLRDLAAATKTDLDRRQRVLQALLAAVEQSRSLGLPALSGEENTLELLPKGPVLCMGPTSEEVVLQAMTAVAVGAVVLLSRNDASTPLAALLGPENCSLVDPTESRIGPSVRPAAVLFDGDVQQLAAVGARVAVAWPDVPIALVSRDADGLYDWTRLVRERMTTINVSAAGGSEQLMMVSDDAE